MKNSTLGLLVSGFAGGVFAESALGFGWSLTLFFILIALALFSAGRIFSGNWRDYILMAVFMLAIALGAGRMSAFSAPIFGFDDFFGNKVFIEGLVSEYPDKRDDKTFLKIKAEFFPGKEEKREDSLYILVKTTSLEDFSYGDRISASGILRQPEKFETTGGGIFNYPAYLSKDGIYHILEQADVEIVEKGGGNSAKKILFSIKEKFIGVISKLFPEPESSLLSGLLVGGKQSLGKEWAELFQRAGVTHIVVLSGYNITIVAESVMKFFGLFLPWLWSVFIGSIAIILFAVMTGGSATVVRASIMALIVVLSRVTGRKYAVTRSLFIAGFLMVAHNPRIVAFDPSFQLSFMATLALVYVSPAIEGWFKFITTRYKIREIFVATVSTQIFVLPILLHMTGQFSVVGLIVNLLILPFVPATMFFGFIAGFVGMIWQLISLPVFYIAYGFLFYELAVVRFFGSLPFSIVSLPALPGWAVILSYVFLIGILFLVMEKIKKNRLSH